MKKKSAFTLIELLVVISIILVASSIVFIGGSGGDGAKLSTAQRIVSGIAQGARGQAREAQGGDGGRYAAHR